MRLPKFPLEIKLLLSYILVSIPPIIIVNLVWARSGNIFQTLLVVFAVFIFVILVSIWFSGGIVKPIKELQKAAKNVSSGNLAYRTTIKTGDELEELSSGFNTMVDSLNRSIHTLQHDREVISAERNKLAVVLSGITDAVIVVDLQRNIVIFNESASRLTGLLEHDVLGKPIGDVMKVYDDGHELAPDVYCPIRTDNFEGVVFSKKSIRLVPLPKKDVYVNMVSGKIAEGPNVNLGCIIALHDVSEEKRLEEMKLDFVSMAAHELRTPLTSLKGYLSVFMQDSKDKLTSEQTMFLTRMSISAAQLTALVENLLSVSRIERGAFNIRTEPLDWVEMSRSITEEFMDRAKDRRIELTFNEPVGAIPKVSADRLRITEVISNLLSNAIAYTQPGGKVSVMLEKTDREVVTHVKDTGQGIPKEAIAHLFTKFFRVSTVLESGSKGTGLGLYISKAIVEMHHGKIWVESQQGMGSTFSFSLPIAMEAHVQEQQFQMAHS